MLWVLSIAVPALLALGVYRLATLGTAGPGDVRDARNGALLVFGVLFALTALYNLTDDGIEPDPYHDAEPPGYAGI